ncbi:uncharacterized protein LOC134680784 isoform X1 [Mytilus trossulus]|uniref:uncharacterized protein LOC134680784 isoform X1 n=2 Tax=Mytilus trossulus TaxID=6551 RepID=UPI003003EA6B
MYVSVLKESGYSELLTCVAIIYTMINPTQDRTMNLIIPTKANMLLVILIYTSYQLNVTAQRNLTPDGTATQSSTHEGSVPQYAIQPPISNTYSKTLCSVTGLGRTQAWWMFHFAFGSAYITNITIYYRVGYAHRMDGFKLYVTNTSTIPPDGYLCYEDGPGLPDLTQTIPCNQLGKYVIYYDTKKDDHEGPVIELCYVAINGCQKGMWGKDCSTTCPSICIGQHCHPENGSCVWGCDEQKCLNNRWDIQTDVCTEGCVREHSQFCNCNKCQIAIIFKRKNCAPFL